MRCSLNWVCSNHLFRVRENVLRSRVVSAGKSQFRVNIKEIQHHLCQFLMINIDHVYCCCKPWAAWESPGSPKCAEMMLFPSSLGGPLSPEFLALPMVILPVV